MKRIVITIAGGAVQDVLKMNGAEDVEIVIEDYDVEPEDAENNPDCKQDARGDWYREMIF